METEELENTMGHVFSKVAAELLDSLKGVSLARRALNEEGYTLGCDFAIEEWANLPGKIAEAVSCLIHCTYSEDVLASDEWQAWRSKVRAELHEHLASCGPIRIIK